MKKRLKINGLIIAIAIISLVLFPALFLRSEKDNTWDAFARLFGIAFILLGQIFRAASRGYKSENSGSGQSLIQSGPYAFVRNPMYLGILLIGSGVVLVLLNWWVAVVFLCIFIWRYVFLMLQEERKLTGMFAGAYQSYRKKVPRLLPSFPAALIKDVAEYLPLKLSWLKKEIGSMLAVLLIVLFLEGWKDARIRNAGIKLYLTEAVLFIATIALFIFLIIYLIRRTGRQQKYASNKS